MNTFVIPKLEEKKSSEPSASPPQLYTPVDGSPELSDVKSLCPDSVLPLFKPEPDFWIYKIKIK